MRHDDLAVLDEITLSELERSLDKHTREIIEPDRWLAFSWSASRHQVFQRCKRQYYLTYYGSRRVREANSRIVSAVWWLKQITSLKAWIGTTIHYVAGLAVRAHRDRQPLDGSALPGVATRYYREGVRASERGAKHDNQWVILFEHIYPETIVTIDRDAAERLVHDTAQTFVESDAYEFIKSVRPRSIVEVDEPFQSFEFALPEHGPMSVYAIPDVLVKHRGIIHIIDWKTGDVTREDIRHQVGVYRLYASQKYRIAEQNIHVALAELGGTGQSVDPPGGAPLLEEAREFIQHSARSMLERLEDKAYNTATIKNFPMTDNLSLCQDCGFKRACWRHH